MSRNTTLFRLKLLSIEVALLMRKICSIANVMLIVTQNAGKYPLQGTPAQANLYMSFQTNNPNCIFTYKFSLLTSKEPFDLIKPIQLILLIDQNQTLLYIQLLPQNQACFISHFGKYLPIDTISSTSILHKLFLPFHRKNSYRTKILCKRISNSKK